MGDANCDGQVNDTDYDIWKCKYMSSPSCPSGNPDFGNPPNGAIDLVDFEIWRNTVYDVAYTITPPAGCSCPPHVYCTEQVCNATQ